jgi:hypothetical protein
MNEDENWQRMLNILGRDNIEIQAFSTGELGIFAR